MENPDVYYLGRMGLFQRHDLHKFNVASVCRLVNEYNMMFAKVIIVKSKLTINRFVFKWIRIKLID